MRGAGKRLETNKQNRFSQNSDFLLHEATGTLQHQSNNLHNIQSGKRDYVAPSTSPRSTSSTQQSTAKPIINANPQNSPSSSGKRDYVAPSTSPRAPYSTSQHTTTKPSSLTPPKRDFVNPRFTTARPLQDNTQNKGPGQVQGLVNFFNSNSNGGPVTPKAPSYSSILQGSTKQGSTTTSTTWGASKLQQPVTQPTLNLPQGQTHVSYSSIVSGSNKLTTAKPSSRNPTITPAIVTSSTSRPGTQLPSAIVNNNHNQGGSGSSNVPTDAELKTLSEELLRKDSNNAAKYVTVNFQEKTTSQSKEDKALLPLMTVSPAAWNIPTIQKLIPLLDNYEKDTLVNEYVTPQCRELYEHLTVKGKTVDDVLTAFKNHFDQKKNLTVERHRFFTRNQVDGETIEQYAYDLKKLSSSCEFGDLCDSLIKDRLVCGVTSKAIRERLLREEDLTLTKAMEICRAAIVSKIYSEKIVQESRERSVYNIRKGDDIKELEDNNNVWQVSHRGGYGPSGARGADGTLGAPSRARWLARRGRGEPGGGTRVA
ncbi:hypothetical protein MSG28_011051 [Choristoneura fumiferana]|uniref:Uncharacterized protein n=1 Tax=Choristoneura fumiferana TaxID=7141 RepID=A0ACC0KQ69_CHOFU|nr:hypothetical protein MSG28_011051 [Choristoneura fumiferana]